jgi:hypothetical protein
VEHFQRHLEGGLTKRHDRNVGEAGSQIEAVKQFRHSGFGRHQVVKTGDSRDRLDCPRMPVAMSDDEFLYTRQNFWTTTARVPLYLEAKPLKRSESARLRLVTHVPRYAVEAGPNPVS